TYGRRTRSVLITDSNQIILSALQPETIINRMTSYQKKENSQ
ncbi:MAG TPA: extracellular matrix/biofilm biosynthesis regulator RemA family protein, partial [Atribacterota bacterium]|nr:extracellular matrix/biofilm biosynthesis regulator RemA family protein [Atribacterota bacterium]